MSRTRTARIQRGAVLGLLTLALAALTESATRAAANPAPAPRPHASPSTTSNTDPRPITLGHGTARVGRVSVNVPPPVTRIERTVHRVVRDVTGVTAPGRPSRSAAPTTSGSRTATPSPVAAGKTPLHRRRASAKATDGPRRTTTRSPAATRARRAATGPRDQQRAAGGTAGSSIRPRRSSAATDPRKLHRSNRFAVPAIGRLFHPGPTVLLLMGFTVALAVLVLLVLMSAGRRTDPRIVASTDRLQRIRSGN